MNFQPEASLDALETASNPAELNEKLSGANPDKPLFIFVISQDPDRCKDIDRVRNGAMRDERVALGAKFFRLIQINGDNIGRDHPLFRVLGGRALPRIVLISRDGETVRSLEGNISASRLFSFMTDVVRVDSRRDLRRFTSDMRKILDDLEGIARERQALERKTARALERGSSPAAARVLQRDQEQLDQKRADVAKRMEELLAQTVPDKEEEPASDS